MKPPRPMLPELPEGASNRCDALQVLAYELDEVVLPPTPTTPSRPAVRILIRGRNLRHRAVPLWASVGDVGVHQLRLDEAAQTLEGVLLADPKPGSRVRISYADMESAEHPEPFDPSRIKRAG